MGVPRFVYAIFVIILCVVLTATLLSIDHASDPVEMTTAFARQARQDGHGADKPITTLRDLNNAFVDLAEVVNPTVVTVFTERVLRVRQSPWAFRNQPFGFFDDFFNVPRHPQPREREYRQQGLGSGVVVSSNGYIITNNHVIANADTINVRFLDGETTPATLVGTDEKTDIALLKVEGKNLESIEFGDSDELRVGEIVLAVGSPLSPNLAHSVTSGIVSAKGRSNVGLADYEDFIQTDAAINPGNSGGALINLDGELVGINTAIASRSGGYQGIGFAVPSNMARRVMESLIEHGEVVRGWIGAYIQDLDQNLADAFELEAGAGALISDVVEDGPSDRAGLRQGDVVVSIDGERVRSATQLRNEVASRAPGSKIDLELLREKRTKRLTLTLGELPTDQVADDVGQRLEEQFGFTVAPLNDELAQTYNLKPSLEGIIVTSVSPGRAAHRAGLAEGDLIVAINRQPVNNLEVFNERVRALKKGTSVLFRVVRSNRSFYVGFRL